MDGTSEKLYSDLVAAEIRAHLGRHHLTGSELARRIGEHHTWINRRLAGTVALTVDDVARIARIFGIDPSELFPSAR